MHTRELIRATMHPQPPQTGRPTPYDKPSLSPEQGKAPQDSAAGSRYQSQAATFEDKGGGRKGGEGALLGQETVLEDGWGEGDLKKEDEEEGGVMKRADPAYSLSYEAHGLAHLWRRGDVSEAEEPVLRSLPEELQVDADAQMLVATVYGCVLRHCLLRDGKGGVHMCNHAHTRLEANVFTRLHYAVRCIQNAKVGWLCSHTTHTTHTTHTA